MIKNKHTKYIIIIREPRGAFEFSTKEDRAAFVEDLKAKMPEVQYITSETRTMVIHFACKRCGHSWKPRGAQAPRLCPKCKSVRWAD